MKWPDPLQQAQLLKRYKRFFADLIINDRPELGYVANTGSLKSCLFPPQTCLISPNTSPTAKLKWTLQAVQIPSGVWVGVNTALPNKLVKEAFDAKKFSHWRDFDQIQSEVKISPKSRIDFCLWSSKSKKKHYVEVKNVSLAENDRAFFPDAVTDRGLKHIHELEKLMDAGDSAEIVFTIQRADVKDFSPAHDIDPKYAEALQKAHDRGLKITPVVVYLTTERIEVSEKILPLRFQSQLQCRKDG